MLPTDMSPIITPQTLIENLLRGISERLYVDSQSHEWTVQVLHILGDIGRGLNMDVHYTDRARALGEFLFDLVWLGSHGMELAVESEWNGVGNVLVDFKKLVHVKAPIKLLVCDTAKTESQVLPKLHDYLAAYHDHRAGEHYVVVDLCCAQRRARCYAWRVDHDGELGANEIRFAPIAGSPISYTLGVRPAGGGAAHA